MRAQKMNREQVYDEKIAPLMTRIIDVCKQHEIPCVASFHLPTVEDNGLRCTSIVWLESWQVPDDFRRAAAAVSP